MNRFFRTPRGSALLVVVITSTITSIAITSLISFNSYQRAELERIRLFEDELHAAETAINEMIARVGFYGVHQPYQITNAANGNETSALSVIGNQILNLSPLKTGQEIDEPINGIRYRPMTNDWAEYSTNGFAWQVPLVHGEEVGDGGFETVTTPGRWNGYTLAQSRYRVAVRVISDERIRKGLDNNGQFPGVLVRRDVLIQLIPPYLFAIFFNGAGGIDAGPEIDIIGKVHVNGNLFATKGGSPAWYHEHVTVAGNFFAQFWDPTNRRTDSRSGDNLRLRTSNNTSNYTHAAPGTGNPTRRFNTSNGTAANSSQQLDSRINNWSALAFQRWGNYVRDQAHGVQQLGFPLPAGVSAREILLPPNASDPEAVANAKLSKQADIYIEGDPTNASSLRAYTSWDPATRTAIPLTTTHNGTPNTSWLTTSTFYNGRERKTISTIDINMGVLRSAIANGNVDLGGGIIYITPTKATATNGTADNNRPWYDSGNTYRQNAVRVINGARVPTNAQGALTLATDSPLYTKGDVNTTNWALLLLAGDSINPLSNTFNDATYNPFNTANTGAWATNIRNNTPQNNWNANGGGREGPNVAPTGATTTNAIFMGGETSSQPSGHRNYGRYSGGGENWFRYIENWSGRNHVFNGSLLNMFESNIATASWDSDGGVGTNSNYYGAPTRVWSWDPRLANIVPPPGFPNFFQFSFFQWSVDLPRNESGEFDALSLL